MLPMLTSPTAFAYTERQRLRAVGRWGMIRCDRARQLLPECQMTTPDPLFETFIPSLPLLARGKVRDIYAVDDQHLLIVTTDRLSAYDVVLPDPIPGKGRVLTAISDFWFRMMEDIVPNHLTGRPLERVISDDALRARLSGRSIVVKRLRPLPIEAVVRGCLIGSGWRDSQSSGQVCGINLPKGLEQAAKLPQTL